MKLANLIELASVSVSGYKSLKMLQRHYPPDVGDFARKLGLHRSCHLTYANYTR